MDDHPPASRSALRFVSAGAAQGLVRAFARGRGVEVTGTFGAVGAMLEAYRAGEPADVVILTHAQIAELTSKAEVVPGTAADLGMVPTSVAVPSADNAPDVSTADGLRAALLAADAIYFPDPSKATAGIHFAQVIDRLGIRSRVGPRLRTFPNGATAMREMAQAAGNPIGCTQSTEILATPGVTLVAPLPRGLHLDTVYTAAANASGDPARAAAFVREIAGESARGARRSAGFVGHAIRPATAADHDAVRAMVSAILAEYGIPPDPADADRDLADIAASYGSGGAFDVVADAGGRVVGSCGVLPLGNKVCELRKMYLMKESRGAGLGRRLLQRAVAFARGSGFTRIELTTASVLVEAIAMYRAHGFRPVALPHIPCRCDQAYALDL